MSRTYYIHKGQIRQDNDCSVRAIEVATGASYDTVVRICKSEGLTPEGMRRIDAISALWAVVGQKPELVNGRNLGQSVRQLAIGRTGVIFVKGHAIGCKDGNLDNAQGYEDDIAEIGAFI